MFDLAPSIRRHLSRRFGLHQACLKSVCMHIGAIILVDVGRRSQNATPDLCNNMTDSMTDSMSPLHCHLQLLHTCDGRGCRQTRQRHDLNDQQRLPAALCGIQLTQPCVELNSGANINESKRTKSDDRRIPFAYRHLAVLNPCAARHALDPRGQAQVCTARLN